MRRAAACLLSLTALAACPAEPSTDPSPDARPSDAGVVRDGASPDARSGDSGARPPDSGTSLDARPDDSASPRHDAGARPDARVPPTACEPLPAPSGTIVRVTPQMADALVSMVRGAAAGTTFVLADGTYRMTGADEASRRIQIRAPNVTIRSESGEPTSVILDGEYATDEIIAVYAPDATIAEITITHARDHAIHVSPLDGGDASRARIYRVRLIDHGEQFIKGNPSTARDAWPDEGRVECSYFEMTDAGRPHVERANGGCYTGGIDVHASRSWVVRRNELVGIYCAGEGLAEHAIHFWVGARDTLIEQNVIRDCARGIGLGLAQSGSDRRVWSDDPYPGIFVDHYGGIVRNNVLVMQTEWYDTGIELAQARGALVVHNTIIETASATRRYSSIDSRFGNTVSVIRNNLARRITSRDDAVFTEDHNVEAQLGWFVDPLGGDVHLSAGATGAIDQGVVVPEAGLDIDDEPHDRGAPDLGADER